MLFTLEINDIAKYIAQDSQFLLSLYVDDFHVRYRHTDLTIIKVKQQQCLNNIENWIVKNEFKFLLTKTKVMHFTILTGMHSSPKLKLGNHILQYTDKIKFLGFTWDPKLTWDQSSDKS